LAQGDDQRRTEGLFRRSDHYRTLNQRAGWLADLLQLLHRNLDGIWQFHEFLAQHCNELARYLVTGPPNERDPETALPLAKKAVALMPGKWMYRNTLGVVYYRLGRYERAAETLERNLRQSNEESAACDLFFLAMCH